MRGEDTMKKFTSIVCFVFVLIMLFSVSVGAAKPYQTYTYARGGYALSSPDAYTPLMTVDYTYMGLKEAIADPRDIFVDDALNVYVVDGKNNRVVVLDRYYKLKFEIKTFINEYGVADEFTSPSGVFVSKELIYVCDTDANRIVTFDRNGNYVKIIPEPVSNLFEDNSVYKPVAVAVDQYGRIFIVSSTTYEGIIVMTSDGVMTGFIGAQAVAISPWEIIWRRLRTSDQAALSIDLVSSEFNNIAITPDGFIYVTTNSIKENNVRSFIRTKDVDSKYSPVKLLNAAGSEIMRRNGFQMPAGEISFGGGGSGSVSGVSKLIDVAVGPEMTWSVIDEKRNKIFTYDYDGNLLFAFGDKGAQLGNIQNIEAVAYQGDTLLVLDKESKNFTVYQRTEYGNILIGAIANQNARKYDKAIDDWTEILKRNSNFDAAYIGIGKALYRSGQYREAMEYYKAAYETANYSDAYKEVRKEWIEKYVLLIPLILIIVIFAWSRFMKYAVKINKRAATAGGKRTFKEELLYCFHVMRHPFDGFWDLKHEKRGSMRAAMVFLLVAIAAAYYEKIGTGYVMSPGGYYASIISVALNSVLTPVLLFAVANWCLTTLFDGEGSFKDILIAISYSLVPMILLQVPATIMSNVVTKAESSIVELIITFGLIWTGVLIFLGMMVTHDYSLFKSVTTTIGTIVGITFIIFVGILFGTLLSKIISFVTNIILEINYRM